MKFDALCAIGHNLADSLASGCGLLVGSYAMDVFGEAAHSPCGFIEVDLLTGAWSGGPPSEKLAQAFRDYAGLGLDRLCASHRTDRTAFAALTARFAVDRVHGVHFTVTTTDHRGRCSEGHYNGWPGRRVHRRR